MLPPIPTETLAANPLFRDLYDTLTTSILNPEDGSTRSNSRNQDALDQQLRTHRAELAKSQVLQRSLENLPTTSNSLPEDLLEIVDLIATPSKFLSTLPKEHYSLLLEDIDELHDSLGLVGAEISTQLETTALEIAKIAYPEEPSVESLSERIDLLPADLAHRRKMLQNGRTALGNSLLTLANTLYTYLSLAHQLITQFLDFSASQMPEMLYPGLQAKASHLATLATVISHKLQTSRYTALLATYDPVAIEALENYNMHLADTSARLVARQRLVEAELKRYEKAGSDMKEIVERYSLLMRSIDGVTKDIKRLGGAV
ncbi:hypothetical protein RUND412_009585 [Rhizina undulata]